MPLGTHPGETDLLLPRPGAGEQWDPATIHTHYFGFNIPEESIGAFIYLRYQPALGTSMGGLALYEGTHGTHPLDMTHLDFRIAMPWPEVDGNVITTINGLRIEVLELGTLFDVSYASADGRVRLKTRHKALTPLVARGHVMPGEEEHHAVDGAAPGGTEQFMHTTGELHVGERSYAIDCISARDRSWRQVRGEEQGGARPTPPIGWTPIYLGPDVALNQISFEDPASEPAWKGLYDIPEGAPSHHWAWAYVDGGLLAVEKVSRRVLERHPHTHASMRQELEVTDETGTTRRFEGVTIASHPVPAWPNLAFTDAVVRWTDEQGRVAHMTFQEAWHDRYQRAMHDRARAGLATA